jgi:hypothetical protein
MSVALRKKTKFYTVIVISLMLAGCGGQQAMRPVTDTTTRLQHYGFSVLPPQGGHWYLIDQGEYGLTFAMGDPNKYQRKSDTTHTLIIQVSNLEYEDEKGVWEIRNPEELASAAENILQAQNKGRFRLIESRLTPYRTQDSDCVRFYAVFEEEGNPRAQGAVMRIQDKGFYCRHPNSVKRIIHGISSERFVRGEQPFADESLQSEVDEFFRQIVFIPLD